MSEIPSSASVHDTAIIHPGVKLGEGVSVGAYCEIGVPYKGSDPEKDLTIIGDNAIIRSHVVIYAGNTIGAKFHAGHKANIRELNTIGDNVSIGTLSVVEHHVTIQDDCRIHTQVFIPEYSTLEKGSWVGPNVVFTNAPYPLAPNSKETLTGPYLETGAKVGANATLLPGVRLGADCLVGAGAVVTKDVATGVVVAGNPAKPIKEVKELPYSE